MKYKLSIIILILFILILFIVAISLIAFLKQFKASSRIANQEKINMLDLSWFENMKKYATLLNLLDSDSSVVKLAKDDLAQIILSNLESIKSEMQKDEEESKNVN